MTALLLYGAGGYTGKLVFAAARAAGLDVVAAGRRVPEEDADWTRELDLRDGAAVRDALRECAVVLNCAGPFAHTWRPLVEGCLETGTHYLDLCAEWAVFEDMQALDGSARDRGVMLLPGAGFEVVASDCLAAHVSQRLPRARRLQIGLSGLELVSRGSARTIVDLAGEPVRVRRGGAVVPDPILREARFDFGRGPRSAYAVSWADVSTAFRTTGIPDIEVYFEVTPLVAGMALAHRSFGWLMNNPALRRLARAQIERLPRGPAPHQRAGRRAVLVARAEGDAGARAEARLVTPEAYTFSAAAAVAVAKRVLAGQLRPGFQTPAALLGPDFVLGLEGVERKDLV